MKTFLDEEAEALEASDAADGFDALAVSFLGSLILHLSLVEYTTRVSTLTYLALRFCSFFRTELFSERGFNSILHIQWVSPAKFWRGLQPSNYNTEICPASNGCGSKIVGNLSADFGGGNSKPWTGNE